MTNGQIPHIELIVGDNELMFEEDTRDGGNVLVEMVCARARPNEIFTRHVRQTLHSTSRWKEIEKKDRRHGCGASI